MGRRFRSSSEESKQLAGEGEGVFGRSAILWIGAVIVVACLATVAVYLKKRIK